MLQTDIPAPVGTAAVDVDLLRVEQQVIEFVVVGADRDTGVVSESQRDIRIDVVHFDLAVLRLESVLTCCDIERIHWPFGFQAERRVHVQSP